MDHALLYECTCRGLPRGSTPRTCLARVRDIGHEQPVGHPLLEVLDHRRLGDGDRQRFIRGRFELDDVRAVILRPVDHDPVLS
jgi:hypothetical protein